MAGTNPLAPFRTPEEFIAALNQNTLREHYLYFKKKLRTWNQMLQVKEMNAAQQAAVAAGVAPPPPTITHTTQQRVHTGAAAGTH